ncbi:hypothetical protein [Psychromicrobium sp. YIM B11713]|uniref:hypothetical protein n=1 Tax=Psychromicrobium sp. YIM B11713 TaxID=3145233 RepID=UPI00374EA648
MMEKAAIISFNVGFGALWAFLLIANFYSTNPRISPLGKLFPYSFADQGYWPSLLAIGLLASLSCLWARSQSEFRPKLLAVIVAASIASLFIALEFWAALPQIAESFTPSRFQRRNIGLDLSFWGDNALILFCTRMIPLLACCGVALGCYHARKRQYRRIFAAFHGALVFVASYVIACSVSIIGAVLVLLLSSTAFKILSEGLPG